MTSCRLLFPKRMASKEFFPRWAMVVVAGVHVKKYLAAGSFHSALAGGQPNAELLDHFGGFVRGQTAETALLLLSLRLPISMW